MRTQASTVLFIRYGLWCLDMIGHGCRAELSPTLTSLLFLPEQDCIREEYMIFINLISHVNLTCLSLLYGRTHSVISRGREIELCGLLARIIKILKARVQVPPNFLARHRKLCFKMFLNILIFVAFYQLNSSVMHFQFLFPNMKVAFCSFVT